jgi:BNR repeat-containing family member
MTLRSFVRRPLAAVSLGLWLAACDAPSGTGPGSAPVASVPLPVLSVSGGTTAGAPTAPSSSEPSPSSVGSTGTPITPQPTATGTASNHAPAGTLTLGVPSVGSTEPPNLDAGSPSSVDASDAQSSSSTAPLRVTKDAETRLSSSGLTVVSYGGYLNGESFQQDGIVTYKRQQYAAFWNANRHVVLARRTLPSDSWETLEFTDYQNSADDAHNTISLGVCPGDGTLHLSFDHHGNDLRYRKSDEGFLDAPDASAWATSSFSSVGSALVGGASVAQVTYPRFVTQPGGAKLLFGARIGSSGSGDEQLWEYDAATHAWTALGRYIDGVTDNINAYPHGLSYTRAGTRLHITWCWRETPDANTNHDLMYAYSDDNGRTWKNNEGESVGSSGATPMRSSTPGIVVWEIEQNRGLINQEHMAVDSQGRVHVLLSHMPDNQANDSNFESSRVKSQFFDYVRDLTGTWKRVPLELPVIANFRGKLAITASNNVYAILPDLRIAGATVADDFARFSLLNDTDSGRFFSDPLIDAARLLAEDKLSIFYPQAASPNLYVLDYTLD